jgi:hypothetical protein
VLGMEPSSDPERVLAADRDERAHFRGMEVLENALDAAVDSKRIRPRRPDDRAAAREQTGDLAWPERLEDPLDEPFPAFGDPDELMAAAQDAPPDGPDDCVQSRAVSAARQHSDLHTPIVRNSVEPGLPCALERRSGGIGRRAGLKIRCPSGRVGSTPTFGIGERP